MKNLIFVDCEADGPCPSMGNLTEFGAVDYHTRHTFHGIINNDLQEGVTDLDIFMGTPQYVFLEFEDWLDFHCKGRPIFVSDNPAFDWQWINDGFHRHLGHNPFGHSARRISDFYAGLVGDFTKTQDWKKFRATPHDHNPVNDAMGNVEAFTRLLNGERP